MQTFEGNPLPVGGDNAGLLENVGGGASDLVPIPGQVLDGHRYDDDQGKDEGDEGEGGCDDKAWATMRRSCMKPSNTSGLQRFSHSDHTIVSTNYRNIPKTYFFPKR